MSLNHERPHPPAREEDILRCETAMGAVLPTWLPLRLLAENGWRLSNPLALSQNRLGGHEEITTQTYE